MAKIGIMGGTFNPIHFGHLKMAKTALEQCSLDKILFVPSGISYMKSNVLDSVHRYEMVRLAIKEAPFFEISDIEIKREGNTYTYETLVNLNEMYPKDDFFFLMGADSLFQIESWKEPELIFKSATILVTVRDEHAQKDILEKTEELRTKYCARILFFSMDPIDISSTEIRNRLAENESVNDMVPETVIQYIMNHHLYKEP